MTACLEVSPAQATAFRLQRQHLLAPAENGVAVASRLLGAQAQVQSAAVLQLRARTADVTQGGVRSLLEQDRRLVKLWAQRATLHLVAIDDVPLALALRRRFADRYHRWLASEGLSADQIQRLAAAIGEALDGHALSRAELSARLTPALGAWARPWLEHSWGGEIKLAASMGMICHGPERGGETTFVRLDGWGELPEVELDQALATLAQRYLATFGPAAPRDFAKFTGLGVPAARAAFDALHRQTLPVQIDGRPARALAVDEADLRHADLPPSTITVLPHFDPYLLAHADTTAIVKPKLRSEIYRTAGWIAPTILRNGQVVASWQYRRQGARWLVQITPFTRMGKRPLRQAERRLRHLAGAFGAAEVIVTAA